VATDKLTDGWYYATSANATFAFRSHEGHIIETAPYLRRKLLGMNLVTALKYLRSRGFTIVT
jgi:hypothetical protein